MSDAAGPTTSEGPARTDLKISDGTVVVLLGAISASGPIGLNIYLPALPAVQVAMHASVPGVQFSVSAGLFAFAVGLLFHGSLSDHFGRKPVVLVGLAMSTIGAAACYFAPTLDWLIAGRVFQSLGMSAGFVIARAIVSDLYPLEKMARMLAYLTMVMVIAPLVSPSIGGLLVVHFGWRSIFLFMVVASVAIIWVTWRYLPETRVFRGHSVHPAALLKSSGVLFKRPGFVSYAWQASTIVAVYLALISTMPYVMVNGLHRTPSEYGYWFVSIAGSYFVGNWITTHWAARRGLHSVIHTGVLVGAVACTVGLALALLGFRHPIFIFVPMAVMSFGQGLTLPNVTASAVNLAREQAGLASSLLGFMQQISAALAVQFVGLFAVDTATPMLAFCSAATVLALLVWSLWSPVTARAVP